MKNGQSLKYRLRAPISSNTAHIVPTKQHILCLYAVVDRTHFIRPIAI